MADRPGRSPAAQYQALRAIVGTVNADRGTYDMTDLRWFACGTTTPTPPAWSPTSVCCATTTRPSRRLRSTGA